MDSKSDKIDEPVDEITQIKEAIVPGSEQVEPDDSDSDDDDVKESIAGYIHEQYKELCQRIRDIHSEHWDSIYNNRKDSLRAKARYYTSLVEQLDEAQSQLGYIMNDLPEGTDISEGEECLSRYY